MVRAFLQSRVLLFEFGLILGHDGIDVGVVLAYLHQFLLNPWLVLEEKLIPLPLHSVIDGENFVQLVDLGV